MHLWSTNVTSEHFADIEKLKEIGYDGIEIFLAEPERANYEEVGAFLKSIDLEVNGCLGLGAEQNPISEDAAVRQAGLDKIKEAIDNMHAAGGKNICGPFHSAFATFSRNSPQEEEYKRSAEVLHAAAEHAAQAGITLTPEALNRFECYLVNTMAQLKKLVDMVDHPNLRGMFDPHHANIEEKSFADAIETIAPVMTHVHISENDRGTPGSGNVAWDEVFGSIAKTGYDGWYYIEAFSRDDLDFANAINVWREFNPRMDICRDGYAFTKAMIEKHAL
ncbi:sugar phosphate isomerase/epimerase [Verrucomicrobiaceae bacterium R5-34]|uniref:Sugar phosphate isomerase/epimerase n=1 Tax=Oceaniferula flava TaxID=2800421 RepID=A0AAE2SFN0_9BACT|nr:sugar phosphate isomerase/epimerase family protein [Oceaniferula flavus]MBK1831184.1 sugar phosphate isomerase/epimerase [Verrucomicrobiaceae bacterium R5-34]MBK1855700.1 sugar phosphate isomerase/epimerase [Oceaniferula flavus]MBM1137006.1 sugar phosphate isomerase/epimerase [Oceaniferula flavus]